MDAKVTVKTAYCSIISLFTDIAYELKINDASLFDCTKVRVSPQVMKEIQSYYADKHKMNSTNFDLLWLYMGPRVDETLTGYEVVVEDGWYKPYLTTLNA